LKEEEERTYPIRIRNNKGKIESGEGEIDSKYPCKI